MIRRVRGSFVEHIELDTPDVWPLIRRKIFSLGTLLSTKLSNSKTFEWMDMDNDMILMFSDTDLRETKGSSLMWVSYLL